MGLRGGVRGVLRTVARAGLVLWRLVMLVVLLLVTLAMACTVLLVPVALVGMAALAVLLFNLK